MAASLSPLFTWRSAICDSGVAPTARHVALTLSLHMSERGDSAWPAVATLAAETGLSERGVQKALRMLEAAGWIEVVLGGGRRRSSRYRAAVPKKPPAAGEIPPHPPTEKGEPGAPFPAKREEKRVNVATEKGEPGAPKDVMRTSVELELSSSKTSSSHQKACDPAAKDGAAEAPADPSEPGPPALLRIGVKNALALAWQRTTTLTPGAWARVERAATEILRVGTGERTDLPPEAIPGGIARMRELWEVIHGPEIPFTPQTASREWGSFLSGEMFRVADAAEAERRRREAISRRIAERGR